VEPKQQSAPPALWPRRETRVYSFGPFRLLPAQRLLLNGDLPVRVGSRALEILVTLIERAGEVVSKEELMTRVWPDTCVEESNLKVQIAALRRALQAAAESGEFIATSNGHGYRFAAPVSCHR
jgi:DNA-binding winged helix-turn-helix (wHTH) protein